MSLVRMISCGWYSRYMVIRVLPDLSVVQNLNLSKVLQSRIVRVLTSYGTTRYDRGKLAETRSYENYRKGLAALVAR